ncbi:hypothetical protein N1851_020376 [Merluccius polli]|uniref:Uncharacterized protein n=1 Tax=Merluccius polli TaxID=89951 RepID=A0AA47MKD1_MERPO|nr:hypothetical protein N1851_020376 [Merluccius polli]
MIAHAPQVCSPTQPESNQTDSGQVVAVGGFKVQVTQKLKKENGDMASSTSGGVERRLKKHRLHSNLRLNYGHLMLILRLNSVFGQMMIIKMALLLLLMLVLLLPSDRQAQGMLEEAPPNIRIFAVDYYRSSGAQNMVFGTALVDSCQFTSGPYHFSEAPLFRPLGRMPTPPAALLAEQSAYDREEQWSVGEMIWTRSMIADRDVFRDPAADQREDNEKSRLFGKLNLRANKDALLNTEGFKNWKRALDSYREHEASAVHKSSLLAWKKYRATLTEGDVVDQMNVGNVAQIN